MTGRLVIFAIQLTAPLRPMTSQRTPVNSPEAHTAAGVMAPALLIAAVPMAFIGWIGTGVRYVRPAMILNTPNATSTPEGSILATVM